MSGPMPHWPDLTALSVDFLFCAINACEGSPHAEDQAFRGACKAELSNRLWMAVGSLKKTQRIPADPIAALPRLVHKPFALESA